MSANLFPAVHGPGHAMGESFEVEAPSRGAAALCCSNVSWIHRHMPYPSPLNGMRCCSACCMVACEAHSSANVCPIRAWACQAHPAHYMGEPSCCAVAWHGSGLACCAVAWHGGDLACCAVVWHDSDPLSARHLCVHLRSTMHACKTPHCVALHCAVMPSIVLHCPTLPSLLGQAQLPHLALHQ